MWSIDAVVDTVVEAFTYIAQLLLGLVSCSAKQPAARENLIYTYYLICILIIKVAANLESVRIILKDFLC